MEIIEIIQRISSDDNGIKLEINNRIIDGKFPNICWLNNALKIQIREVTREILKYLQLNGSKNATS